MPDDDFILDADEAVKTVLYELTGWEVVVFELADDEERSEGDPSLRSG